MAGILPNSIVALAAYKLVMIQLMVGEANRIALDLDLPCKKPILVSVINRPVVRPPLFMGELQPSFGGTITTSNFFFGFDQGRCWTIVRCNISPHGRPYEFRDPLPCLAELARTPSKVTTNRVYSLATNRLARFKVRIPDLELKDRKPIISQLQCLGEDGKRLDTGIYYVKWGSEGFPVAEVSLLGTTGELLELRIEDASLNQQPTIGVTNWQELMATPEKTLKKAMPARSPSQLH